MMMKNIIVVFSLFVMLLSCTSQSKVSGNNPEKVLRPQLDDEGEYDLIVIDSQYDYYLNAIAKSMNMYSESYLKSKNTFLVSEWNSYYYSGRYRNVIESSIDYDPKIDYGLRYEYKLYQVFAYVQWKYGLRMNGL